MIILPVTLVTPSYSSSSLIHITKHLDRLPMETNLSGSAAVPSSECNAALYYVR
jgi:hypothetical protein